MNARPDSPSPTALAAPPARVGDPLDAIDTPALLVDLDALERNLAMMRDWASAAGTGRPRGLALRPHAKTHKCATLARLQIAAGAVGVCVQKVAEAEALAAAGVPDLFVSNEVVGDAKLDRLAALARRARVAVAVDCDAGADALARAAERAGVRLRTFVEIDVGQGRCGIEPGAPAAALAERIARHASLEFAGLHAYHGGAQHLRSPEARRDAIAQAADRVRATRAALAARGLSCPLVTGAGTGTFVHEAASGAWDELQPGSYVFMDVDYARNRPDAVGPRFEQSLWVLATVMSRSPGRAVIDAGLKAVSVDSGLPRPAVPGWRCAQLSDEHGVLVPDDPRADDAHAGGAHAGGAHAGDAPAPLAWGERLRLAPGHCDPTVNLHDWLVAVRGGRVEALWPVEARGALG